MKWSTVALKQIAPAESASIRFGEDEEVWHLTLDQIETHTGRILGPRFASVSAAGNSTYVFDQHNVLYSKLRPYLNKVVCLDRPGIATTELVPLRPDPRLLNRHYLTYYVRSPAFFQFISTRVAGAKMPRVIMKYSWQQEIPLPPLSEQRRIVEILDQADRLRQLRREADAKAARILPALFIHMFGDPAINPMGWDVASLGSTLAIKPRIGTITPASNEGQQLVVRVGELRKESVALERCAHISLTGKDLDRFLLKPGDVLLARAIGSRSHLGKASVLQNTDETVVFDSHVMRLRFDSDIADSLFFYHWLGTEGGKARFLRRGGRTAVQFNIGRGNRQVGLDTLVVSGRTCRLTPIISGALAPAIDQVVWRPDQQRKTDIERRDPLATN